ncbi:hypothetical protein H6F89_25165 [Cyanobacteria bacterium FACHB-63]|nr:hypothetical protein [Cyanobacteria bacterium FACHB-63]
MQLVTAQNPMNIDEPATIKQGDFLLMAIDRGNSGSKIAVSVNGCPLSPFKIPSVIRKVGEGEGLIKIGNQAYLCGESAISMTTGATSTPLGRVVSLSA